MNTMAQIVVESGDMIKQEVQFCQVGHERDYEQWCMEDCMVECQTEADKEPPLKKEWLYSDAMGTFTIWTHFSARSNVLQLIRKTSF